MLLDSSIHDHPSAEVNDDINSTRVVGNLLSFYKSLNLILNVRTTLKSGHVHLSMYCTPTTENKLPKVLRI